MVSKSKKVNRLILRNVTEEADSKIADLILADLVTTIPQPKICIKTLAGVLLTCSAGDHLVGFENADYPSSVPLDTEIGAEVGIYVLKNEEFKELKRYLTLNKKNEKL